ncbi:MAG TPA: hypothetical protein ENJ17_03560 [Gammaproteobacteria bacterium]|nr:hypothetical protein [Gammaproteobacteria bacterium]
MTASFKEHVSYGVFGLLMGIVLSYTGFTSFEEVHHMFTLADYRLLAAFAASIGLSMIGFLIIARGRAITRKAFNKGTIPGSVLFGAGWALTGACPSIALVQLGEGKLAAVFTLLGILSGVWAYRRLASSHLQLDTGICGEE